MLGLSLVAAGCKKTLVPQIKAVVNVSVNARSPHFEDLPRARSRCKSFFTYVLAPPFLPPISPPALQGVLPYFTSAHPRVRHAAIRCIGQLVVDFSDPSVTPEGGEGALGEANTASSKGDKGGGGGTMGRVKDAKTFKSIQETSGGPILKALIAAAGAQNAAAPRLRGLAAAAIVNLCSEEACTNAVSEGLKRF